MGTSTAGPSPPSSSRVRWGSSVTVPMTANGHRSRRQNDSMRGRSSGSKAMTYRSWASLHQISIGLMPGSAVGIARSASRAPSPSAWTSSGTALASPPAPTSWMDRIGLRSPSRAHESMTSWARRCISALSRWTDAKSSS